MTTRLFSSCTDAFRLLVKFGAMDEGGSGDCWDGVRDAGASMEIALTVMKIPT
jgi:hypothetical protein